MDGVAGMLDRHPGRTVVVQGLPADCLEAAARLRGRDFVLAPRTPFHGPDIAEALHYKRPLVLAVNPTCPRAGGAAPAQGRAPGPEGGAETTTVEELAGIPAPKTPGAPQVPVVTCFTEPGPAPPVRASAAEAWSLRPGDLTLLFSSARSRPQGLRLGRDPGPPSWADVDDYVRAISEAPGEVRLAACAFPGDGAGGPWEDAAIRDVDVGAGFSETLAGLFPALPEQARVVLSSASLRARLSAAAFFFPAEGGERGIRRAVLTPAQLDAAVLRLFARNAAYARGRMGQCLPARTDFSRVYLVLGDTSPETRRQAVALRGFLLSPGSPLPGARVSLLYLGPRPDEYKLGNLTDAELFVYLTSCPACATPWLNPAFGRAARQPVPFVTAYELQCLLGLRDFDFDYENVPGALSWGG